MFDLNDICAADRRMQRHDDDGWVTINGTHVMVSGGKATGGACGSKLSGYDFSSAKSTKGKSKKESIPVDYDNPEYLRQGEKAFRKEVQTLQERKVLQTQELMDNMPVGTVMKIKNPKTGKMDSYQVASVDQYDPDLGSWKANKWVRKSDINKSNLKDLTVDPLKIALDYRNANGKSESSFKLPRGDIMDLADAIMVYEQQEYWKNHKWNE